MYEICVVTVELKWGILKSRLMWLGAEWHGEFTCISASDQAELGTSIIQGVFTFNQQPTKKVSLFFSNLKILNLYSLPDCFLLFKIAYQNKRDTFTDMHIL